MLTDDGCGGEILEKTKNCEPRMLMGFDAFWISMLNRSMHLSQRFSSLSMVSLYQESYYHYM